MAIHDFQEVSCDTCPENDPTTVRRPVGTEGLPDDWTISWQSSHSPWPDGVIDKANCLLHCPKCSERVAEARRRREKPGRRAATQMQGELVTA